MDTEELRGWITIVIAIIGLIILAFGTYFGITELQNVNINLKDLTSEEISTKNLQILNPNGSLGGCMHSNGSHMIIGGCP